VGCSVGVCIVGRRVEEAYFGLLLEVGKSRGRGWKGRVRRWMPVVEVVSFRLSSSERSAADFQGHDTGVQGQVAVDVEGLSTS
jgi:hypothetical protein